MPHAGKVLSLYGILKFMYYFNSPHVIGSGLSSQQPYINFKYAIEAQDFTCHVGILVPGIGLDHGRRMSAAMGYEHLDFCDTHDCCVYDPY